MKHLKTILVAVVMLIMAFSFTACGTTPTTPDMGDSSGIVIGGGDENETPDKPSGGDESETPDKPNGGDENETPDKPNGGDENETPDKPSGGDENKKPDDTDSVSILVVYFSCTNTTKIWALNFQSKLDADIYEIVPAIPYTEDDLKYYTGCRADNEQNDPTCRPIISGGVEDMSQYDVVYIGYPIWHGQAPKIIYTFLESYDFSGKTIIPFCTSMSSGMGSSGTNLHRSAPNAIWKNGCRVSSASNIDTLVNEIKR